METWYSKQLGTGVEAYAPTRAIQDAWESASIALYVVGDRKWDMAIFSRHDLRADIVTAYFSPSAASIAQAFGATPCAKPLQDERLCLMAGDQRAIDIHFPGD